MNKKILIMLLNMHINSYLEHDELNNKYLFDEDVIECQIRMYLLMMIEENDDNYEKKYQSFLESYNKLNNEQQEYIKNDYLNIINAQINNKEKVKKKGMIDYE